MLMRLQTKRAVVGQAPTLRTRLAEASPRAILQLAGIVLVEAGRWVAFLGELALRAGHQLTRTGYKFQESAGGEETRTQAPLDP